MALTLSKRMDIVEQKLAGIESLPERMTALESQFLQLRTEMRGESSAVQIEMRAGDEETRRTLREEIHAGDEETRRVLRDEIAALGTHMRVLHEDLVERISRIQEGRPPGRPRPRR
jgi:hypothetical protein